MDLTLKDLLDRYGPALAVVAAIALLAVLVPGNVDRRSGVLAGDQALAPTSDGADTFDPQDSFSSDGSTVAHRRGGGERPRHWAAPEAGRRRGRLAAQRGGGGAGGPRRRRGRRRPGLSRHLGTGQLPAAGARHAVPRGRRHARLLACTRPSACRSGPATTAAPRSMGVSGDQIKIVWYNDRPEPGHAGGAGRHRRRRHATP